MPVLVTCANQGSMPDGLSDCMDSCAGRAPIAVGHVAPVNERRSTQVHMDCVDPTGPNPLHAYRDAGFVWPVLGYTLHTAVWLLTHVWYRNLRGCCLFPRVVQVADVQCDAAQAIWNSCHAHARKTILSEPCVVAMRPDTSKPALVYNGMGCVAEVHHCADMIRELTQPANVIVRGAMHSPDV